MTRVVVEEGLAVLPVEGRTTPRYEVQISMAIDQQEWRLTACRWCRWASVDMKNKWAIGYSTTNGCQWAKNGLATRWRRISPCWVRIGLVPMNKEDPLVWSKMTRRQMAWAWSLWLTTMNKRAVQQLTGETNNRRSDRWTNGKQLARSKCPVHWEGLLSVSRAERMQGPWVGLMIKEVVCWLQRKQQWFEGVSLLCIQEATRVSQSVCRTTRVATNQVNRRRGTLKEKECHDCGWHVCGCDGYGTEGVHLTIVSACGSLSVRQSEMWNGD